MKQEEIPAETEADSARWWKSHLNTIGLFIGTHGLAVFLVVFYTVYLYPRSEAERKEWIEQITRIRQIIEPETRTLTATQADAVLSIARRSFIQDLQHTVFQSTRFRDEGGWGGSENSMRFWNEDFRFSNLTDKTARSNELRQQLRKFNIVAARRLDEYRTSMIHAFEATSGQNEVLRYQLGRLRTETGSMDELWIKAYEPLREEWIKSVANVRMEGSSFMVQEFEKLLQKQPDYAELSAKEPKEFEVLISLTKPGVRTDISPISRISSLLEQNLAKELNAAYSKRGQGG